MQNAPYHGDVAAGPKASAHWLTASDGVRIRIGHWPVEGTAPPKGTVLLFPGRTEYIEKYGRVAADFAARGFATLAIDWRGQGLADRLHANAGLGHVLRFSDYQKDVAAVLAALPDLGVTGPLFLIGHSMGGAIGLRALHNDLPVQAAAFSAPMWGIHITSYLRPIAWVASTTLRGIGLGNLFAPGTSAPSYLTTAPFEDNTLTRDPAEYEAMRQQVTTHPELSLGGPSMLWLNEALREMRKLRALPAPDMPTLTLLGDNERIVHSGNIHSLMARWPKGTLQVYPEAEHEILMEVPSTRQDALTRITTHFETALTGTQSLEAAQ
ncbi:alpha/beta hydrolase [Alphaproteobacteria bacterium KMM 3653]|uniref:Alpha/beta hydrolase n=1 Tax=Harenicola maris TaxID=2841044 RepID=A0AAP2G4V9_9RHOB|nr:alpha/beta hydrolase [Harenicola maris]